VAILGRQDLYILLIEELGVLKMQSKKRQKI